MLAGPYLPATPNAGAESDDGKFLILNTFQYEVIKYVNTINEFEICNNNIFHFSFCNRRLFNW